MRRRAPSFIIPAKVTAESVVGVLVAADSETAPDPEVVATSMRVIAGHLHMLKLELIPIEKPRRPWWRPKRTRGGST